MSNIPLIFATNSRVSLRDLQEYLPRISEYNGETNHPDVMIVELADTKSIGIKQVQEFINWVQLMPYQAKQKLGIIYEADLLTEQAQNALLKTLEEVSSTTQICLITANPFALLDTVRSRSSIIELAKTNQAKESVNQSLVSEFIKANYPRRVQILQQYCDQASLLAEFVEELITYFGHQSRVEPQKLEVCKQILLTISNSSNIKLTMQTLAISM